MTGSLKGIVRVTLRVTVRAWHEGLSTLNSSFVCILPP